MNDLRLVLDQTAINNRQHRLQQQNGGAMPRGKSTFRTSDIRRAIKAVTAAGIVVSVVEIGPDGKIVVRADNDNDQCAVSEERNEWDDAA